MPAVSVAGLLSTISTTGNSFFDRDYTSICFHRLFSHRQTRRGVILTPSSCARRLHGGPAFVVSTTGVLFPSPSLACDTTRKNL